ncbi:hypothetical protein NIB75_18805 [Bacteroides uniformis]|nr:hypothetical protein [Bacteroides uniformis]
MAEVRIVGIFHAVKQAEVMESLSGNPSGHFHFPVFGIHYDILSGHGVDIKIPAAPKSTTGVLFV